MAGVPEGRHLIPEKDFVPVYDEDGNATGATVPKHWGPDQLPVGHSTKKPSGKAPVKGAQAASSGD